MGGLAGGTAGAFGGHALGGKAGHGKSGTIIGALTGAFAGHKAQDAASDWKDERDKKKMWAKQQQQQSQTSTHSSHSNHGNNESSSQGDSGANFTASSQDIRLDAHGDYNLHASCRRPDGSYQSSTISLNKIIQHDGGSFRWAGGPSNGAGIYTVKQGDTLRAIAGRFNHCSYESLAQHNNIRLVDGGQKLEGELLRNGEWYHRSINLDERISNRSGCLEFV